MTWDVLLLCPRPEVETAEDLSEDAIIEMGTPAVVRAAIQRACPQAIFSDATTGQLEAPSYTIQFSLGDDDPVRGVLLLISGDVSEATITLAALCASAGWRAFDMNTEEFIQMG
ncbi:MAG: hypothetical protein IVW57_06085 [Ktedonobacterales bacterium]|nr:hypothetical protein [Ktedonobacterales bacterium]